MEHRRAVELRMRKRVSLWGYREVCTPEFEELELFTARSGQGIIEEMYVFEDKGGRMLALRPEITAAVQRMYLNEAKVAPKPLRWFYFADCFRYERPQKGRYRQFWQFGVELIGSDTATGEAEVIMLADEILRSTGIGFSLHVGHLDFMKSLLSGLPAGEQRDAMRYLDKKDFPGLKDYLKVSGREDLFESLSTLPGCRTLDEVVSVTGEIQGIGKITETLEILDNAGTDYTLNPGIARGLDYYTGMVFEAFAENLGAENQILGGGAYRLAQVLGGDDVPSSGFAIGFDRVMVAIGEPNEKPELAVGIVSTPQARSHAVKVAGQFRAGGVRAELDVMGRGIGAQITHASKSMKVVIIVGERELKAGAVTLKDLETGEQKELAVSEAIDEVKKRGPC
jgi:histidyl-tRNA synthetase